ncbi:MAG: PAS domain S-box protein, partial [Gammaproteobacteria bacterium]|nr:PAS domain S-box protein [Gammaproteobacteria bacterium]
MQRSRIWPSLIVLGLLVCLASGWLLGVDKQKLLLVGTSYVTLVALVKLLTSWWARRANPSFTAGFEALACGVAVVNGDGRISWVNDALANLLGHPANELVRRELQEFMSAPAWESLIQQRSATGGAVQIAGGLARADGSAAWVSGYASPLFDGSDELVVQVVDLSSYRDSHASLLQSVSRYRQAVDTSDDLIIMVDQLARIRHTNPAAAQHLERGIELNNASLLDFIEPDDRGEFTKALKATRDSEDIQELALLHLVPDAQNHTLTVAARIVSLAAPGGMNGAIVSCRILGRQLASEAQLRDSEARFSRIFHSSPDAILIVRNEDSTVLDFNTGFTNLLGYTREDAIGREESDLNLWVHGVERERILDMLATTKECTGVETKLRTREGSHVYVELSLRYIEIEGELCILCIGRDVSKRTLAEAALKESQDKFAKVFSRSPDGIVIIRQSDMTICDINDVFIEASGFTREELVGSSLQEL